MLIQCKGQIKSGLSMRAEMSGWGCNMLHTKAYGDTEKTLGTREKEVRFS